MLSSVKNEHDPQVTRGGRTGLISRVDEAPEGTLVSGKDGSFELPAKRQVDVAVIATSQNQGVGLFSEEVFGSAMMFDVVEQAKVTDLSLRPMQATRDVIRQLYARSSGSGSVTQADSTDIEMLIRALVDDAEQRQASDIHIETRNGLAEVFYRINGERLLVNELGQQTALGMGRVLYGVHADSSNKETGWSIHKVTEGSIDWTTSKGERLQLRFSSSPIFPAGNFQIVIRLASMRAQPRRLSELGYSPAQQRALATFTTGSGGLVLMAGPTNSGKSVSLQSLIEQIYGVRGRTIKVITVEDPVEAVIDDACQISVGRQRSEDQQDGGTRFEEFLRGTLRQDPDVIVVGEMRDSTITAIACDLALAGRKVLSTIHSKSALWAFVRLREMGVKPELLTMPGFIAGACYQQLVPTLCRACRQRDEVDASASPLHQEVSRWVSPRYSVFRRGDGCPKCSGTGIVGRTLVSEMLVPDQRLLELIAAQDFVGAEAYWLSGPSNPSTKDGIATVHDHLVSKILAGDVSIEDGLNYVGFSTAYHLKREAFQ